MLIPTTQCPPAFCKQKMPPCASRGVITTAIRRHLCIKVFTLVAIYSTNAQNNASLEEFALQTELTQTKQLRQLAEFQQKQIHLVEDRLKIACDNVWQTDAYILLNDFSNAGSRRIALEYLKEKGFRPNVIFDIGANTGESAKMIFKVWGDSSQTFTIHSFEPVYSAFDYLKETLRRIVMQKSPCEEKELVTESGPYTYCKLQAAGSNVIAVAHHLSLSRTDEKNRKSDKFIDYRDSRESLTSQTAAKKGVRGGFVPSVTVDTLLYGRSRVASPQLIVCNVKDWSYMIIEGMLQMLSRHTAEVFLFEVGDGSLQPDQMKARLANAVSLLDNAGYDSYLLGDTFHLKLTSLPSDSFYNNHGFGNVIALRRDSSLLAAFECLDLKNKGLTQIPYTCQKRPYC